MAGLQIGHFDLNLLANLILSAASLVYINPTWSFLIMGGNICSKLFVNTAVKIFVST